jgi:hypothetical protein
MREIRKLGLFLVFLVFCVNLMACSMGQSVGSGLKKGWKDFLGKSYVVVPSPQPGLVLPINRSPGVWAECWLFEGNFSERELIIPHSIQRGKLTFAKTPIKHFVIDPPMTRSYSNGVMSTAITVPLLLSSYPADYTLLIFHQNFRGWVVKIETRRFSTTGYALNDYYVSGGRKIYADQVIKLARVRPYERRRFRFHRTYYPGHVLKDALGLP